MFDTIQKLRHGWNYLNIMNSKTMEHVSNEQKDLLLQIPDKLDDTVKLYVDGVFVDRLDVNQVNQYRINVVKYINETGDSSILNRFYFVGHKDSNYIPGEEIKIEMDEKGNISDIPYEMAHVRRHMYTLIKMDREYIEYCSKIKNE